MITILRGIPGSGKSTWAKAQENVVICSADDYMVDADGNYSFNITRLKHCHAKCFEKALEHVALNDLIIDNTNTTLWEMAPYRLLAHAMDVPLRVKEFKTQFKNIHGVPEDRVAAWKLEQIPEWWLL